MAVLGLAQDRGQPLIAPPQLGWLRDANHGLRSVTGLAANFILGESLIEGVVSSASSGSFTIVKTGSSVLVLDHGGHTIFDAAAEAGPALFAFSDEGIPAFAYLPRSQFLLKWNDDRLTPAPFDLEILGGAVQAIASPGPDRAAVVVKRDDGLWLVDLELGTQTFLPGIDGVVLLRNDGALLYAGRKGFVLRQADGSEQAIQGSAALASFEQMGKDWVHVIERDSSRHFAIRLEPGREQLFQLPEGEP
jgi:hypothetical protein